MWEPGGTGKGERIYTDIPSSTGLFPQPASPQQQHSSLPLSPEQRQTSLMASPSHCPHGKPPGTPEPRGSQCPWKQGRGCVPLRQHSHPWGLHWQLHVSHSTVKITTLPPRMIHDAAEGLPSCYFGSLERELMAAASEEHMAALGSGPRHSLGLFICSKDTFLCQVKAARSEDGHLAHILPAPRALSSHSQAV